MATDLVTATKSRLKVSPDSNYRALKRTARATGLWYLALGITGMIGFLLIRPQIFAEGDAAATLANLDNARFDGCRLAGLGSQKDLARAVGPQQHEHLPVRAWNVTSRRTSVSP